MIVNVPAGRGAPSEPTADELERVAFDRFGKSRRALIAETAYFTAEHRGFQSGDANGDWYEAERQVDRLLRGERPRGEAASCGPDGTTNGPRNRGGGQR